MSEYKFQISVSYSKNSVIELQSFFKEYWSEELNVTNLNSVRYESLTIHTDDEEFVALMKLKFNTET